MRLRVLTMFCVMLSGTALFAEPTATEIELLRLVNEVRVAGATCPDGRRYGPMPPLQKSGQLFELARSWSGAQRRADTMTHGDFAKRIRSACRKAGKSSENIASARTAQRVMELWMNSVGHCRNIMNPRFGWAGVGHAAGGKYGGYWTINFDERHMCR